ncbi:MAG: GFA family protein [Rubrobacteraceae bacterium]
MNGEPHEGGCLCGGVRYTVSGYPESSDICHCVSCRQAAGAQSVAWLTFPIGSFSFVSGQPVAYRSSPDVTRTFCGGCGTSLTYRHDGDLDTIDVTTASLDWPEAFPPTYHVWMEDKVGWESIDNRLPRFQRGSPAG